MRVEDVSCVPAGLHARRIAGWTGRDEHMRGVDWCVVRTLRHMLPRGYHHQDSTWCSTRCANVLRSARRPVSFVPPVRVTIPTRKLEAGVGESDWVQYAKTSY